MSSEKLTMPAVLERMSRVMVFNITHVRSDGVKDVFQMPNSLIEFYADSADAKAALERAKKSNPKKRLELEAVPLGKAFALTQGVNGMSTAVPTRLLFSSTAVADEGDAGVPKPLRDGMRSAGPFPLFFVQQLASPGAMPFFLSREDLAATWLKSGRTQEALETAEVEVLDLRILAASAIQVTPP